MSEPLRVVVEQFARGIREHLGFAGPFREVVLRGEGGREIALPLPGWEAPAKALTPTEAAIVAAMRGRPPSKAAAVAARADRAYNANFRKVFKGLQRRGLVEPDPSNPRYYRLTAGAGPG